MSFFWFINTEFKILYITKLCFYRLCIYTVYSVYKQDRVLAIYNLIDSNSIAACGNATSRHCIMHIMININALLMQDILNKICKSQIKARKWVWLHDMTFQVNKLSSHRLIIWLTVKQVNKFKTIGIKSESQYRVEWFPNRLTRAKTMIRIMYKKQLSNNYSGHLKHCTEQL